MLKFTLKQVIIYFFLFSLSLFLSACNPFGKSAITDIPFITLPESTVNPPPLTPVTPGPSTPGASLPEDLSAPLFEDDFNRADQLLTLSPKWTTNTDLPVPTPMITQQEMSTARVNNGSVIAIPSLVLDSRIYLESSFKAEPSTGGQMYAILPYSDVVSMELVGCFLRENSGDIAFYVGSYIDFEYGLLNPVLSISGFASGAKNFLGCDVNHTTGSAAIYLNSIKLGEATGITVPSSATAFPLFLAQGDTLTLDDVKAFPSFAHGRRENDQSLRIYNASHAEYDSHQLSQFNLQGYCSVNGAYVQIKDAGNGGFQSTRVSCVNHYFSIIVNLTNMQRFPLGSNVLRLEYDNLGVISEYFYNFTRVATPAPVITISSPSPVSGDETQSFLWDVNFSGAVTLNFPSTFQLAGDSIGCIVNITGVAPQFQVEISGCKTTNGQVYFKILAGAASNGEGGQTSEMIAPYVQISNPVKVEFLKVSDSLFEGNSTHQQGFTVTLDRPANVDIQVGYYINTTLSTALNPLNFNLPVKGAITIPAGVTSGTIFYNYHGDAINNGSKIIQVSLDEVSSTQSVAYLGEKQTHRRVIKDEESSEYFVKIAPGHETTCGITNTGQLKCWGRNDKGQIGDGTFENRIQPTGVSGSETYIDVALGDNHTCAITSNQRVQCWGIGTLLGNNSSNDSSVPVFISGSEKYIDISAGGGSTCGITENNEIKCWGYRLQDESRYSNGWSTSHTTDSIPTAIGGGSSFISIALGSWHGCARTDAGLIYCWGSNMFGNLGNGSSSMSNTPVLISGGESYIYFDVEMQSGKRTCGLTSGGVTKCWGQDVFTPQPQDIETPYQSLGFTYQQVSKGYSHECAIDNSNTTFCWKKDSYDLSNFMSAIGLGYNGISSTFLGDSTTYNSLSLSSLSYSACGITTLGRVRCWGTAGNVLGDGSNLNRNSPTYIADTGTYIQVSGSSQKALYCGISTAGELKCWGGDKKLATVIDEGVSYQSVSVGEYWHSCALTTAGKVKCWGYGYSGELGTGQNFNETPTEILDTETYAQISAAAQFSCGLTTSGYVKCWGKGDYGVLGNGSTSNKSTPTLIDDNTTYRSIATGRYSVCGVTTADTIKCWGTLDPSYTPQIQLRPMQINDTDSYKAVTVGDGVACGLLSNGRVKCWGRNYGNLGLGYRDYQYHQPTLIQDSSVFKSISMGVDGLCGLLTDGRAKCWGSNTSIPMGLNLQEVIPYIVIP